jgi:casein kinase 1
MIGLQLIKMIQNFHEKGFLHRNINLSNIQFGKGNKNHVLFFNDLLEANKYYNKNLKKHIEFKMKSHIKNPH